MIFKGTVENIIFQNEENGYRVIEVGVDNVLYVAVGTIPPVSEGETVEIDGELRENPKYGEQIVIKTLKRAIPDDREGMIKFLASDLFTGIGEVTATMIVDKFGEKTFDIIENDPGKLAEVRGVSIKKAMQLREAYISNKEMQAIIVALANYDISVNVAMKIYKAYGAAAVRTIEENPYVLIDDVDGIGFHKADKIAMELGIDSDSKFRIKAGISYILNEIVLKNGHTHLPKELLIKEMHALLGLGDDKEELFNICIDELEIVGRIVMLEKDDYTAVILSKYYVAERSIASRLINMLRTSEMLVMDMDGDIREYERINNIVLHENQVKAVKNCLGAGVNVITGGPGTGKTTIIKCIIGILKSQGKSVVLCAPTGRAAKRLSEATGEQAKTVHRLLDLDFKNGKGYFTYDENCKLDADVVIIDEVSMCDEYMFNALIKAIKWGGRLIMVGDKDQLPSVGAGNVLADVINANNLIPVSYLTQIYRQDDETGMIIENAHRINRGEMPIFDNTKKDFFYDNKSVPKDIMESVVSMVTTRIPNYRKVQPKDIQVLCPMKKGVAGVDYLNIRLQESLNPPDKSKNEIHINNFLFREGDKIIHTVNNYQLNWIKDNGFGDTEAGTGVFNGDIGYITEINKSLNEITVTFEDGRVAKYTSNDMEDISLAYAISIHKSQGSEFPIAVIAVTSGNYMILTRNLLYTAVTRAKEMVVLIGDKENIGKMVRNNYTQKRYSLLKDFIIEESERVCRS